MGQRFEHLGPRRAWRVSRHQPKRFAQVLGIVRPAEPVLQVAEGQQQQRGPDRFRSGVDLPQRGLGQRDPPVILPGQLGRPGRRFEHRGVTGADPLRGVRDLLPQFQYPG